MILPILAYGDPILRKKTKSLTKDYPKLDELLDNMFETMYTAHGIGLAAPQVGLPIRLFIVDTTPFEDDEDLTEAERENLHQHSFRCLSTQKWWKKRETNGPSTKDV